jgi:hypothetical protein
MSQKTSSILFALFVLVCLITVTILFNTPVQAQSISTGSGNCVNCHENLYFLHDTGNWFCLRESPMGCVDCHGGDPEALTREMAHARRAAHPIIKDDVSKCQECHPKECGERVEFFAQTAGISQIKVAAPYTPAYLPADDTTTNMDALEQEKPDSLLVFREIIPLFLLAGLALTTYLIHHIRHHKTNEKE